MTLRYNLLEEPLIRTRLVNGGQACSFTLPGLLHVLGQDAVRDFPALRPHQRHPWHAFLVQLAAIALHRAGRSEPYETEAGWKQALLDLTPNDPDGAAWCLVAPSNRPAFMQPPIPQGQMDVWANDRPTPDSLDVLVTSKGHDLKPARIRSTQKDDWIFSLVSLQTQAPYPGAGNFGIARMNGGSSSRPGVGIDPGGNIGNRWQRDVRVALEHRKKLLSMGYKDDSGISLLWLLPWDGESSLPFSSLDPYFIEVCRRIRLFQTDDQIYAQRTTTKGPRISKDEAKARKGNTGDLWTPVHGSEGKSFGASARGFNYERMAELAFGTDYVKPPAQIVSTSDSAAPRLELVAQAIAGGQSTTDGYHERRIPISPRVKKMMIERNTNRLSKSAEERVHSVGQIAFLLRNSIVVLLDGGKLRNNPSDIPESLTRKASKFSALFEQAEDARFFAALNDEIESENPEAERMKWLLSLADRAEAVLKRAFVAGPQCGEQRYRAQAAALSRFHGGLRNPKTLPDLANLLLQQSNNKEPAHEYT